VEISAGGAGPVLDLTEDGTEVHLIGLSLRDGVGKQGGAVTCTSKSLVVAEDLQVTDSTATEGGAVYVGEDCWLTAKNVAFTENSADFGSHLSVDGTAELRRARFHYANPGGSSIHVRGDLELVDADVVGGGGTGLLVRGGHARVLESRLILSHVGLRAEDAFVEVESSKFQDSNVGLEGVRSTIHVTDSRAPYVSQTFALVDSEAHLTNQSWAWWYSGNPVFIERSRLTCEQCYPYDSGTHPSDGATILARDEGGEELYWWRNQYVDLTCQGRTCVAF
jgi:hypothetical protein